MTSRKTKQPPASPAPGTRPHAGSAGTLQRWADRLDPWFPWVLAGVYTLVMGYLIFRYHRIGRFGVETDFYAELVPQARKLLDGEFSPINYGAKGPVYSVLLTGVYLIVRDYFYAGLVLNLMGAFAYLVLLYHLIRRVFNLPTAVLVTMAAAFNALFQGYTFRAGSDIPFMALCVTSMYFLFRDRGIRDVALSAVFGLLAFLTRYNGAFILMGSMVCLAVTGGALSDRLKRMGLWIGVFILAGLPWFIPNYLATGSPVHNDNYINVMLEFYGLDETGSNYENWQENLPKEFTGLGDIILHDPVYFAGRMIRNAWRNLNGDLREVVGWRLGIPAVLGFILLLFLRPDRRRWAFFSFALFYFAILTLVFYNPRFSLYLITFYLALAVGPFLSDDLREKAGPQVRYLALPLIVIIASYAFTASRATYADITNQPDYLEDLKDLGTTLRGHINADDADIIARRPHVAYFAGINSLMFPGDITTVDALVVYCRENDIEYILYSGIEAYFRPAVKELYDLGRTFPGLERVYYNSFGIIYHVTGTD